MEQTIDVLLEVTSNRTEEDLAAGAALGVECERELCDVLDPLRPGDRLAQALALPATIPVRFDVRVLPRVNGHRESGPIPLKAKLVGMPLLAEGMRPAVEDELGDQLFRGLRQTHVSAKLGNSLGFPDQEPLAFELEIGDPVPQVEPQPLSMACVPGSQYSWSKGCSSWPW